MFKLELELLVLDFDHVVGGITDKTAITLKIERNSYGSAH